MKKNLPLVLTFTLYYVKKSGRFFQIFVAFSENFKKKTFLKFYSSKDSIATLKWFLPNCVVQKASFEKKRTFYMRNSVFVKARLYWCLQLVLKLEAPKKICFQSPWFEFDVGTISLDQKYRVSHIDLCFLNWDIQ